MIEIKEFSYFASKEYISKFEILEKPDPLSTDWIDVEDSRATYIWVLENIIDKPLGFLSYKVLILPNRIDFIYIVKIYVLHTHRGEAPNLIEGERISSILFRELAKKEINIFTLESACEQLDRYYAELGFRYIKEVSTELASVIETTAPIMHKIEKKKSLSDIEKAMFG